MTPPVRFSAQAEIALLEIAAWTTEKFGPRQADTYRRELIARTDAIAQGTAHRRSCAALAPAGRGLFYVAAGEHFLLYEESAVSIVIVDIVHSRSDLPAHLSQLGERRG
ncbi:MAG: type II toxin-antitoxin system RelE/ParE family toxin [Pseudomonadota bacterium]